MKTHHINLQSPGATAVSIAGSFNDWSPDAKPMACDTDGCWGVDLTLPPGRYEYRFVVDGQWRDDPNATEYVINPFASRNTVLVIEEDSSAKGKE